MENELIIVTVSVLVSGVIGWILSKAHTAIKDDKIIKRYRNIIREQENELKTIEANQTTIYQDDDVSLGYTHRDDAAITDEIFGKASKKYEEDSPGDIH